MRSLRLEGRPSSPPRRLPSPDKHFLPIFCAFGVRYLYPLICDSTISYTVHGTYSFCLLYIGHTYITCPLFVWYVSAPYAFRDDLPRHREVFHWVNFFCIFFLYVIMMRNMGSWNIMNLLDSMYFHLKPPGNV